jgi:protein TonB
MKIIKGALIILILFSYSMSAQEELDKMPKIKGGIAELVKNVKYPKAAKEEGIMGKVFVKAKIDENGDVIETEVVKSVNEDLDAAAVKAVKLTKFIPGEKDGKKVTSEVTIPIKFKLDDKKKKS